MMQAGKDYIAKDVEYESPRALYLRELLKSIAAQDAPTEVEETTEVDPVKEAEPVKPINQNKPMLKLK